jgi:hypothetical protein
VLSFCPQTSQSDCRLPGPRGAGRFHRVREVTQISLPRQRGTVPPLQEPHFGAPGAAGARSREHDGQTEGQRGHGARGQQIGGLHEQVRGESGGGATTIPECPKCVTKIVVKVNPWSIICGHGFFSFTFFPSETHGPKKDFL